MALGKCPQGGHLSIRMPRTLSGRESPPFVTLEKAFAMADVVDHPQ